MSADIMACVYCCHGSHVQAGVEGGHVRRCLCRRVVPLPSIINPQLIHGCVSCDAFPCHVISPLVM